jgi:acetyl-CoA carboxylase biotin carboxylase subunit
MIRKLLIANRGEIARRVMRTCREMGISTVAVFSEPDRNAPFVREADEAVALGGTTPAESYLQANALVHAANRTGADAIHPGYGFLAENADFARQCEQAGLLFIGPPSDVIAAMGSKLEAKRLMQTVGVPVLPGDEVNPGNAEATCAAAERLGWPLLVKASAGGGGRGMRIISSLDELLEAVQQARSEAASAFGDDTIFLEPYIKAPRHVEVQIFGDHHGNVVHLFERECSIQRRYQKILEEAPSVALDETLREKMGAAAVTAARAIGYLGAGTVEFILTPEGDFYFLEMNTRLQVEHPVTECVTGLDLVRLQLLVAQGEPLPPEALRPVMQGHAIEVRLYAEDPERDFLPTTGTLHRFRMTDGPGLRVDSGVQEGSVVSPYYDPLLAKLIAHASTRMEAAQKLVHALTSMRLHGLRTNRDLLVRILRHPEFLAGQIDTHFLERHPPAALGMPPADEQADRLHAAATALAAQSARRRQTPVLRTIPSGWRNNPSQLQEVAFETRSGRIVIAYRFDRSGLVLTINGVKQPNVRLGRCTPEHVELEVDGIHRIYEIHRCDSQYFVDSPLGHSELHEIERFPRAEEPLDEGSLLAPMPGQVIRVAAKEGEKVEVGSLLVVIEAMKMQHLVTAPHAGRIREICVQEGQQVEAGTVLVVIDSEAEEGNN